METAAGTMTTSPAVLVDVTNDQGVIGHSYARCYTSLALAPLRDLIANLGERGLAGSSGRPEEAQTAMRRLSCRFDPNCSLLPTTSLSDLTGW